MTALTTIGLILIITAAVVSVIVCLAYPLACKVLEQHLGTTVPDWKEDEAGCQLWRERRWALDKYRLRVAIVGMVTYAVGMFTITFLLTSLRGDGQSHPWVFAGMVVVTASLLLMSLRSMIHNERCSNLDDRRRYPDLYRNS